MRTHFAERVAAARVAIASESPETQRLTREETTFDTRCEEPIPVRRKPTGSHRHEHVRPYGRRLVCRARARLLGRRRSIRRRCFYAALWFRLVSKLADEQRDRAFDIRTLANLER